jgi:hypothetical protein
MKRTAIIWTAIAIIIGIVICINIYAYYSVLQHATLAKTHASSKVSSVPIFSHPLKTYNREIEVSSYLPLNATEPFEALVEAIKIKKKSTRFRVTWSDIEPGGPFGGTMVYDRKRKIIKLYDENWFHGSYYRFQYLITEVSDEDITRYVKEHSTFPLPHGMGFYSFIGIFRTYGSNVYRIERRFKGTYANQKPWWPDIQQQHSKSTFSQSPSP